MGVPNAARVTAHGETKVSAARLTDKTQKDEGLELLPTTVRMMRKADDNKVFITLIIAIITYIASQFVLTRDSAHVQPYVDKLQDQRIEQNTKKLEKIDVKLDIIIDRIPQK
jgi:hypothetical protein